MSNTLTHSFVTRLPHVETSKIRDLQFAVEYWKIRYAEAGSQKERCWRAYDEAIEKDEPRGLVEELFVMAKVFEAIAADAWGEYENAKRCFLLLLN